MKDFCLDLFYVHLFHIPSMPVGHLALSLTQSVIFCFIFLDGEEMVDFGRILVILFFSVV